MDPNLRADIQLRLRYVFHNEELLVDAPNVAGETKRLSTGLEALLGAVYLDAGAEPAISVTRRLLSNGPAKLPGE